MMGLICRGTLGVVVGVSLIVGMSLESNAAGFWNFERGTSVMARGGAVIASIDDPVAAYFNPAGLTGSPLFRAQIDANALFDRRAFTRAPDDVNGTGELTSYDEVVNHFRFDGPSPGVWLSGTFGKVIPGLAWGISLYGPPKGFLKFDADGPQRYSSIRTTSLQVHSGASLAYAVGPVSVGVTVQNVQQGIRVAQALNLASFASQFSSTGVEDPAWDIGLDIEADDPKNLLSIWGLQAELSEELKIGMSLQTRFNVRSEGVARTTLGDDIPGEVDGDQIKVALDMPAIARAGIHYAPTGSAWSFDAGFVYEEWSRAAQIRFRPQGIAFVGATPEPELIPEIYVKTGFQDAWSIRFGGTRDFEELDGRLYLGSFYETGASSELGITPASMDLDKVGISAGWHQVLAAGLSLDFAIAHQEWLTREVTDGQARLIDPLTAEELHPTNNGTFTNRRTLFHAAVTWQTS